MFMRKVARRRRRGAAAIEMALLAPPLCFMAVATVDFGRVYYASATISNCARNGAIYASDPIYSATSPYASVQEATLADAGNVSPTPTVSSSTGTDSRGDPSVSVTVSCPFTTIMTYPGIPTSTTIARTVQMRVAATTPN